jgi:hypothetical protein
MSIKDELLAIKGDAELLRVDDVIVEARSNPESYPLIHDRLFSRTDAELAEDQRRQIVRQLIAVYVVDDPGERILISLTPDRTVAGGGYREIQKDVLPYPDLRARMLDDAIKDIERVQAKYKHLSELAAVWDAKDVVKTRSRRRGRRPRPEDRPGTSP